MGVAGVSAIPRRQPMFSRNNGAVNRCLTGPVASGDERESGVLMPCAGDVFELLNGDGRPL